MKITKAVIAVAGYGTRFLPATKVQPKEMLPIVDKPVVQYLVEEAVASGITDIILVTRSGNQALEDHFDSSRELEIHLETQKKWRELEEIQRIPAMANFIYVRQTKDMPYGNGTPLLCAKSLIHPDEAVVYMFGDDIVKSEVPCAKQLMDVYYECQPAAVIAVQEVPMDEVSRYGVPKLKPGVGHRELEYIVEKPAPEKAPSNLAQLGRFVLSSKIIDILEGLKEDLKKQNSKGGENGELWLTDAIDRLAATDTVIVHPIEGKWLTTGDPLRFLKTTVEFALDRPDIGEEFAEYLRGLDLSRFEGGPKTEG
jgi:UTP--glucose-1-phosphate uridylyltransferase